MFGYFWNWNEMQSITSVLCTWRRTQDIMYLFCVVVSSQMCCSEWVCSLSSVCRASVPAGWTSPTRLCRLPHCLLADAPHSDMCVPAHLFRPHYCQACINKYPGVERSSVPVLHHRGAQSAGRPLLSCSKPDRNHDYTVSTVVIHLLPKLRHCTPSYTPAPGDTHTYACSCTCTHIRTGTHTRWQTNTYRYLLFHSHYFSLQCNHGCAGNTDDALPLALLGDSSPVQSMFGDG